jgi:L-fuculose-phosphate aldolase
VNAARARREVVAAVRWLMARGLYTGTSGNVSCRGGAGFLVTPTGIPCDDLGPADVVEVSLDGEPRGPLVPSSEWRIHRDLYRARPEIGAVVHTHSLFATALACLRRPVPSFHYMLAKTGGPELRCARYATYGTAALSSNALRALAGRRACLLANHGLVALGRDLAAARLLAEEVESLCAQYVIARSAGSPVLLPKREMAAVAARFAGYGQPAASTPPRGARRAGARNRRTPR